ncbi:FKBP-type peptidyl-prolyl cis-trans isomerase [Ferrimonas lipolytica]|uniref:Peptidyl-prolyl cis-trans isomerase n=1 Tax=Ferrimonas lipolytica TaxID=2724191 RepID=A0A6H1U9H3_9GAMM|nr:FKBP-type peptidyl-prolyl cis-trans isomerase [Ferrimonas lipolytica]QIZ75478.1 peptidylprolyl isomerase [Ferrimonas lipolytica]
MKTLIKPTLAALSVVVAMASPLALAKADLNSDADKESYAIGASLAKYTAGQLATQEEMGLNANIDLIIEGFAEALRQQPQLDTDTMLDMLNARAIRLNEAQQLQKAAFIKENEKAGKEYLANNKKLDGVIETESGLQYQVLRKGTGPKPAPEDVVTVNFVGKTIEGFEFENTFAKGAPAQVALINVIDGWNEGLQLMKEGGKYRFVVPAELAYGNQGMGDINPQSTLIFDIELVTVDEPGVNNPIKQMMHGMSMDQALGHQAAE